MTQAEKFIEEFKALGLDPDETYLSFASHAEKLAHKNGATEHYCINWEIHLEEDEEELIDSLQFKFAGREGCDPVFLVWFHDGSAAAIENTYQPTKEYNGAKPQFVFHIK